MPSDGCGYSPWLFPARGPASARDVFLLSFVSILRIEGKGLLEFLDGYIPHLGIGIGETFGLVSYVVGKERLHQFVSNLRTEVGVAAESYIGQQFHEPFTALVNGNVAVEFHGRAEQRVAIAIRNTCSSATALQRHHRRSVHLLQGR